VTPPPGDGVPSGFVDNEREITGSFRVTGDNNNVWRTVSFILGLIIAGGTVFSILGKAFYVTRAEYTDKVLADSIERTSVTKTLESVNKSLSSMEAAIKDLSDHMVEIKTMRPESDSRRTFDSRRRE